MAFHFAKSFVGFPVFRFSGFPVLWLFMAFLFLPGSLHAMGAATGSFKGKPLPPVEVKIMPVEESLEPEDIRPGDVVELAVTARSFIDAEEMRIEVKLTGGAELIEGEAKWSGPVKKNGEKTLLITVRASLKGAGKITARAAIPVSKGPSFSARAMYRLGGEAKKKALPKKKDGLGRDIIEYPAR